MPRRECWADVSQLKPARAVGINGADPLDWNKDYPTRFPHGGQEWSDEHDGCTAIDGGGRDLRLAWDGIGSEWVAAVESVVSAAPQPDGQAYVLSLKLQDGRQISL